MNEPHPGFIGLPTIQEWVSVATKQADITELQHRSPPRSIPFSPSIILPRCRPPNKGPQLRQIIPLPNPKKRNSHRKPHIYTSMENQSMYLGERRCMEME
jgi:hypothetical protein